MRAFRESLFCQFERAGLYLRTDRLRIERGTWVHPIAHFSTGLSPPKELSTTTAHRHIRPHTLDKKDGHSRWPYRRQHGSPSNSLRSGANSVCDERFRPPSSHRQRPTQHASGQRKILCDRNKSTPGCRVAGRPVGRHVSCGIGHVDGDDGDEAQGARL